MTFAVIATGFLGLTAQERPAPMEFNAKLISSPNTVSYVLLSWIGIKGEDLPQAYNIYQASGQTEDVTKFDKVGSVAVDPKTPPRENIYTFSVKNLKAGVYTFFVKGVWGKDEGPRTRVKVVVIDGKVEAKIWFVSKPVTTGKVGVGYEYAAKAESGLDGRIRYGLVNGPDGMTVNAETGAVIWKEPRAGRYEITIKAYIEINGVIEMAKQSFVLEIGKTEEPEHEGCATIFGKVKIDGVANSLASGVVTAWRLDVIKKENGDTTTVFKPVYKAAIKQGSYVFYLPKGVYKLRVEGSNFLAEWFENSTELADAIDVEVACDTRTEANFVVAGRPEPTLVVVSGRVFDAITEGGLKALVVFEARSKEDNGVDARYHRVLAETNADGVYEIKLQSGVNYIAYVKVIGSDKKESQYLAEFWENTHDGSAATLLNVTENKDGVNFSMDKRPVFENGFGGMMRNAYTEAGVKGKVIAYQLIRKTKDGAEPVFEKRNVQTVETDANFGYEFSNLEPGVYIVFGIPADRPNVPGWMLLGAKAATEWREATRVEVGEVMIAVRYDINLDTAKGERGKGRVRGFVYDKRGGIVNNGKDQDQVQGAPAIVGSLVVARDESGAIVDFSITENEGAFDLTELNIGDVTITADRVDFEPTTSVVTIDAVNADQQISLGLIQSVSSVEVPVDAVGTTVNLFPNPASANASVRFMSNAGTADVRILSMTGIVLATQNVSVNGGETTVVLNTASMPVGMVMVQVTNGSSTFALPLQIVR